jgi:hypothetical protein
LCEAGWPNDFPKILSNPMQRKQKHKTVRKGGNIPWQ